MTYEVRQDDISVARGQLPRNYWRLLHAASSVEKAGPGSRLYLESARLLEVATNTSKKDVNRPTHKKEPVVVYLVDGRQQGTAGVTRTTTACRARSGKMLRMIMPSDRFESALEAEAGVAGGSLVGCWAGREVFEHCSPQ